MFQLLRRKNADVEKGFTLMEVMVAIVILTIGLMATALLMANVYKNTVRSRYVATAAALASEKLEDLNRFADSDKRGSLAGGSLTADLGPLNATWNGTPVSVDYYDSVTLNNSNGAMNETYEIVAADGTTEYVTQTFTADGLLHWDSTNGLASAPSTAAPTGITFKRRWVIEQDTPVTGVHMITVLVTLMDSTVQPPVTFQMSMVRP
ncbi:MAG: prepilin-type N-terminal cleavage/methylation domain-containing protein [Acidobacteriia bacterium]|nr:prepilin-type N-terminal cleavage/methylation domain-containing protein [Terriglobia bacterium]